MSVYLSGTLTDVWCTGNVQETSAELKVIVQEWSTRSGALWEPPSLKWFSDLSKPHTRAELRFQNGALSPKETRVLSRPLEGSTFTISRHNLMSKHWSVMAENVPQPNRRKTVKKAFIAPHNFSLLLIWVLRPVIWLQFFICGCLFQIIKLFL